jgi:hypothetical protein
VIRGTGGRDHCRQVNYRTNVYSTMCDTPKKAGKSPENALASPGGRATARSAEILV